MTATATAPTLEDQVAALKKEGASIAEALEAVVKKLDEPVYGRPHAGDGVMGYWEPAPANKIIKTRIRTDGKYQALPKSMPKNYRPFEVFKSGSEFYHDLIRQPGDFAKKYEAVTKAIQGMSTQVGAEGGNWIMPEFSDAIIDTVYSNDLWSRTDGYTVGGNNLTFRANAETSRANGSRHGGLRGYWTNQGAPMTSSLPRTRKVSLELNTVCVLVYLTDQVIDDAGPALEQYVGRKASEEFQFLLGDAMINGTGVNMPLGIANSPAFLAIAKEAGQLANTILAENIDKMWARRIVSGDYIWLNNQDVHPQLAGMSRGVGVAGDLVYNPPGGIADAPYATLKGRSMLDTEFNATVGTLGDLMLVDPGKYITISKGGVTQAVSVHVEFLTNQTALRFTMRVDGRPADISPITPYKGSNTQSHFLGIATRS